MKRHKAGCTLFSVYHHSNSLLFQFILAEFMYTFRELKPLPDLISQLKSTYYPVYNPQKRADLEQMLRSAFIKLTGHPQTTMRIFSGNFESGMLFKLKNYTAFFRKSMESLEKELSALQSGAEKAWALCAKANDLIHLPDCQEFTISICEQLEEIVKKTIGLFEKMAKAICHLLTQFSEDENVIYFLVRRFRLIDEVFGVGFVFKLLNSLYVKGMPDVKAFLKGKYSDRGFETIVAMLDTQLAELNA